MSLREHDRCTHVGVAQRENGIAIRNPVAHQRCAVDESGGKYLP